MPTRYLKPGICDSDRLDKCSPLAETLFYRLLVNVDDFGRFDARPSLVKSKCWPLRDEMKSQQVQELLVELQACRLLFIYTSNGCSYIQMQKWDNVPRSKESKFPAPSAEDLQLHTNVNGLHTVLPVTVTVTVTDIPKPITVTKELSPQATTAKKGTRLPEDWQLSKTWGEWAASEQPNWTSDDIRRVAADFKDHWLAKAGKDAVKMDWLATWRKWVRSPLNEVKPPSKSYSGGVQEARLDIARQIFGDRNGTDRQIIDIDADGTIEGIGARIPENVPFLR